jgi:hypothetical protein
MSWPYKLCSHSMCKKSLKACSCPLTVWGILFGENTQWSTIIKIRIFDALYSNHLYIVSWGPETMAILWEEWLGSNDDWKKSQYAIRLSKSHSHEKIGARRWMTFKQLIAKYDDVSIAESIRESKRSDPKLRADHVKPHPDCPQNDVTRMQLRISLGAWNRTIWCITLVAAVLTLASLVSKDWIKSLLDPVILSMPVVICHVSSPNS